MQAIFNAKDFGEFETECKILKELLKDIELFENYEDFKNELLNKSNLKGKKFFHAFKDNFNRKYPRT